MCNEFWGEFCVFRTMLILFDYKIWEAGEAWKVVIIGDDKRDGPGSSSHPFNQKWVLN